jgi:hypothetical protein
MESPYRSPEHSQVLPPRNRIGPVTGVLIGASIATVGISFLFAIAPVVVEAKGNLWNPVFVAACLNAPTLLGWIIWLTVRFIWS